MENPMLSRQVASNRSLLAYSSDGTLVAFVTRTGHVRVFDVLAAIGVPGSMGWQGRLRSVSCREGISYLPLRRPDHEVGCE